jgi:glucan phosphoethanolaminetransferase (alkaline phosphatase superfamily)
MLKMIAGVLHICHDETMFKKFSKHLILAFIFFLMTLTQQYLFYYLKGIPVVWLTLGKYLSTYLFLLVATFIRPWGLRYTFLAFILILNFFQMAHLSYFGTQILPNEIFLLLTQFHEIQGTLLVEIEHVFIPFLFTIFPAALGFYAVKKTPDLFGTKVIGILFIIYFIYNPMRTFVTGNTWGRQPSTRELAGMNVYLSFSYFAGKILPHKIFKGKNSTDKNTSSELFIGEKGIAQWDNIIFILGESLTPYHMSLFGYEKETTPFLLSQANKPNFFHTIGLSGGVSTDISVAFLLNMGFGGAGSLKAAKGQHCLFKLAKEKKFTTHFLSSQSAEQLRYIAPYLCAASLDDYRSLEDISPETKNDHAADDKVLLPELEKLIGFEGKQFIMLHQRGSHAPWELRSMDKNRRFPHNDKVNHYDNSVVEFDLFIEELSHILKKSKDNSLVIYVSDHGEALGQEGFWGHGQLLRATFEIPILIFSYNKSLTPETRSFPKFVPHFNISLYLASELGFRPSVDYKSLPNDYVIFGSDIDGFAGKADISFKPDGTYDLKVIN